MEDDDESSEEFDFLSDQSDESESDESEFSVSKQLIYASRDGNLSKVKYLEVRHVDPRSC